MARSLALAMVIAHESRAAVRGQSAAVASIRCNCARLAARAVASRPSARGDPLESMRQ
eukprot:COSAG02_NODE_6206_length_3728_cov_3.315514_1_plen_58_part_00